MYGGRIFVIDEDYKIVKDTYGVEAGKTIISPDVIQCFSGASTSRYDAEGNYIEITTPITEKVKGEIQVKGVILTSVSSDIIRETLTELEVKADLMCIMVLIVIAAVGFFIASVMTKPFEKIATTIEDITEGFENDNLDVDTYTETKKISDAFNKMRARMKVLDDSRQEFVSNVSHELKTPLTSMKVLADSLVQMPDVPVEYYREFMEDISAEIDRENAIIADLLTMVKLDKTQAEMNIQPHNINELLELILKRLRPIAEKQNIEMVLESFREVTAEVDEVKLTLALTNFVENAIKYNKENGWVHVSLDANHKYFFVKVIDSGCGIPEEAQEHIFERFYRVDKSHSREIGGTGLGLAIAKNIVLMHKGIIEISSVVDEGTTITVRIPLNYIA